MSEKSQELQILAYLKQGKPLTAIDALNKFNCFRLAARIKDLRYKGYSINSTKVKENGKSFAVYSIGENV